MKSHLTAVAVTALTLTAWVHGASEGSNVPSFYGVPTAKAFAENDMSRVVTIASADFDKRNGPDLVTIQADGMLNGIYNDGRGNLSNTYHNSTAVALKPNIVYIEAADLNGDGFSDLVAMDSANSAFLVFVNNKDGTFEDATSVAVGAAGGAALQGGGLTVADVNADGKSDVVTIARSGTETSTTFSEQTFVGTGDGTFEPTAAADTSLPGSVHMFPGKSISVADVNGDSIPDLVLQLDKAGIVIAVSPGTGDGSFRSFPISDAIVRSGPQPASSLTLGDVNGDQLPDAVFVNFSDKVYVAPGLADGSFGPPVPVASNLSGAVLIRLADVNEDGSADVIVFAAGEIGVLAGKGDGTFQLTGQYVAGYGLFEQPAPADFNGDGHLDIVGLDYTNGQVGLYTGKGDGTFSAASPIYRSGPDGSKWAANSQVITGTDLNGDGAQDILMYEWVHATVHGPADLYTGVNDGSGNFFYRLALPSGKLEELGGRYNGFAIDSTAADFNGDRRSDVIYRTGSGISIALANENGTLREDAIDVVFPVPVACMPFNYVTTGDVNGDGTQDIVTGFVPNKNCGPSASTPSGFFVLLGDGQGHFEARFTEFGAGIFFVKLADWNGDGKLDLALANSVTGQGIGVKIVSGKGDGSFDTASPRTVIGAGQFVSDLLAFDYTGDGKTDLVVPTAGQVKPDGTNDVTTAGALLLPGNGDLTFGQPAKVLNGVTSIWNGAGYGDFNKDGRQDFIVSIYSKAQALSDNFGVTVLPNEGTGSFGEPVSLLASYNVGGRHSMVFVADFNLDGAPDILTANGQASQLYLNTTGAH